jgi:hypothetical protein
MQMFTPVINSKIVHKTCNQSAALPLCWLNLLMRFFTVIFLITLNLSLSAQLKREFYDDKQTQLKSETD